VVVLKVILGINFSYSLALAKPNIIVFFLWQENVLSQKTLYNKKDIPKESWQNGVYFT
jgi:hypothetical protein